MIETLENISVEGEQSTHFSVSTWWLFQPSQDVGLVEGQLPISQMGFSSNIFGSRGGCRGLGQSVAE